MSRDPLAYFLTFHVYGTRLHGDGRGSVDRLNRTFGEPTLERNPQRERFERSRMSQPSLTLDRRMRGRIVEAVAGVCDHRGWPLFCLHLRTTHVHVVVAAPGTAPERPLADFKAYATRRLREAKLTAPDRPVWSRHGSTEYLFEEDDVRRAVRYTLLKQGAALEPAPLVLDEYCPGEEPRDESRDRLGAQ